MADQREDPPDTDRIRARNGSGADDGPVIYGKTMRLDILLKLQDEIAASKDDMFFVVLHQCHELWFKLILHELENARDHIAAGEPSNALEELERVRQVERSLVEQVSSLATLTPESFDVLRGYLGTSSAFQSAQFREIEFLSGLKDHVSSTSPSTRRPNASDCAAVTRSRACGRRSTNSWRNAGSKTCSPRSGARRTATCWRWPAHFSPTTKDSANGETGTLKWSAS